jgi:hypothetical protein
MGEIAQGAACEPGLGLVVQVVVVVHEYVVGEHVVGEHVVGGHVVGGHAAFQRDVRSTGSTGADGARARVQSTVQLRWHVISKWDEVVEVGAQAGVEPVVAVRGSAVGSAHPPGWR